MWNCEHNDINGSRFLNSLNSVDNIMLLNTDTKTHVDSHSVKKSNIDLILASLDLSQNITYLIDNDTRGSDHHPLVIGLTTRKFIYRKIKFKVQSVRTDWHKVNKMLDVKYSFFSTSEFANKIPKDKYKYLINLIRESVKKSTPVHTNVSNTNHRNPVPWWDNECDKARRVRIVFFKK